MSPHTDYYENLTYGNKTLNAAKVKIKTARSHLRELEAAANELPKRRGYYFVIKKPQDLGASTSVEIVYMPSNNLPLEFSAVIGDVVHNLRVVFDYAAFALSCPPNGTGNPEEIYFPVGKSRSGFHRALNEKMRGAKDEAKQLIEDLEPYPGGKHSICELHQLDIRDKHKLIVIAASKLRINGLEVRVGDQRKLLGATDFQSNADGSNFSAMIEYPSNGSPQDITLGEFNASFDIVYGKGFPLEGKEVLRTLSEYCDVASGFIIRCESLFP